MVNLFDQVLKEAIQILQCEIDGDIDLSNNTTRYLVKKACEILDVPCECDYYNGFDCGCSRRSGLIELTENELNTPK